MKKIIRQVVFVFVTLACMGSYTLATANCKNATREAERTKKIFVQKVQVADVLGNEYNTCMHDNKDDQRVCSEIKKKHKKARLERVEPRRIYYKAAARQKRACPHLEQTSTQ